MKRLSIVAVALMMAAPAFGSPGGQGAIVLRAKGPVAAKLATGKPVPAGTRVALQPSDVVMLLDGKGVRTLTGPGYLHNGAFTRTGPSVAVAGERIGAVRGAPGMRPAPAPPPPAQTWTVPLADVGAVCLPADRALTLWRRGGPETAIEIAPAGTGAAHSLAWPAYSEQVSWPQGLSTAPGAKYRLTSKAFDGPREIEFRALSADDPACAAQIDFNVNMVANADEQMLDEYLN